MAVVEVSETIESSLADFVPIAWADGEGRSGVFVNRHLHRMVPDGPTRFVGGRRQVHQVCECGEEGWR